MGEGDGEPRAARRPPAGWQPIPDQVDMPHLRGYSGLLGVWEGSLCVDRHISRVGRPITAIFRPTPAPQVTSATQTPPAPTSGRRPLSRVVLTTHPFVRARAGTHIPSSAAEPTGRDHSSLRACPAGQADPSSGVRSAEQTGLPGRSSPGPAPPEKKHLRLRAVGQGWSAAQSAQPTRRRSALDAQTATATLKKKGRPPPYRHRTRPPRTRRPHPQTTPDAQPPSHPPQRLHTLPGVRAPPFRLIVA